MFITIYDTLKPLNLNFSTNHSNKITFFTFLFVFPTKHFNSKRFFEGKDDNGQSSFGIMCCKSKNGVLEASIRKQCIVKCFFVLILFQFSIL